MKHTLEDMKNEYTHLADKYKKCSKAWNCITFEPKTNTFTKNFEELEENCRLTMKRNKITVEYHYVSNERNYIDEDIICTGKTINKLTLEEVRKIIWKHAVYIEKQAREYRSIANSIEKAYADVMAKVDELSSTLRECKEKYGDGMYECMNGTANDYIFGRDDNPEYKRNFND